MLIPDFRIYLVIGAFVTAVLGSVYFTARYKDGQYALKAKEAQEAYLKEIQTRQEEYNRQVEELNRKALERQKELTSLNSELERKYAQANKRAEQNLDKYNDLLSNGWRLRDPAVLSGDSMHLSDAAKDRNPDTSTSRDRSTCRGELSREASQYLLNLATEADKVVEQLKVAQEYAIRLKGICEKVNE